MIKRIETAVFYQVQLGNIEMHHQSHMEPQLIVVSN
jgi:hypothetical protein